MLAFLAAVALGVVGVWMIVTGQSTKAIRVGAIASFWALLLGAFAVLGSRVPGRESDHPAEQPWPSRRQPAPPPRPHHGELDRRRVGDIERAAVAAARREFQAGLQEMLRREVAAAVSREMAGLRSEVNALRNEVVEKVGGQIRLERIETTRLIGSDLEALQREVRQLRRSGGASPDLEQGRAMRIAHPLDVRLGADHDVHDAEIVLERVHPPAAPRAAAPPDPHVSPATTQFPRPSTPPWRSTPGAKPDQPPTAAPGTGLWQPAPQPAQQPAPHPVQQPPPQPAPQPVHRPAPQPPQQPVQRPAPQPAPQPTPAAAHGNAADPFAGLPRISPFTEFPLDMIPSTAVERGHPAGGRRHRPDESGDDDVLARILARERGR